jgi:hypothetical protein
VRLQQPHVACRRAPSGSGAGRPPDQRAPELGMAWHSGAELALGARVQRARRAVEEAQPHLVAHCKLQVAMVGVVVASGDLLHLEKAFPDLRQELVMLTEEVVDGIQAGCAHHARQQRWRRPPIHNLERCSTQGGVEGGVVAVLHPPEPIHPCARPVPGDAM